MTQHPSQSVDPQDHVAAISRAAAAIEEAAACFKQANILCTETPNQADVEILESLYATKRELEAAAEAFIDAHTERDELLAALVDLVQEKQPLGIEREAYQTAIALVIKHHDCADSTEASAARRAA